MSGIRRRALLAGATVAFGGFLGLADGAVQHSWLGVDQAARGAVGLARLPQFDTPMQTLSLLGDRVGLISLIAVAVLLLWPSRRRWAVGLPVVMAGTGGLQLIAKWAVDRPRPNLAAWGYPSGHVLSLVVFFGLVAYLVGTSRIDRRWRWLAAGASAGTVLGVAFSRLYLDVHWLSDVIGGFALGLAYLLLTIWLVESSRARARRPGIVPPAAGGVIVEPGDSLPGHQAPTPA